MRWALGFGLLFFLIGCSPFGIANAPSTDTDVLLKIIFSYANTGDREGLERMKDKVSVESNKTLALGYSLALYIASPNTYERQYVEAFPVDYEGIMYDLYEQVELKRLTPTFLYSVASIGSIAKRGNEKAIEKVFRGYAQSDGAVAASFCDSMIELFGGQAQKTVAVLSRIEKDERQRDYSCLNTLTPKELAALKNNIDRLTPTASREERLVIEEVKEFKQVLPAR